MSKQYRRVKPGCYMGNITMSVIGNLSPVLFLTFRTLYDTSYSLLGLKMGMLVGMLFPMASIPVYYLINKNRKFKKGV
ncbi:MAG: hypothetical protein IKY33_01235 [Clostridia bacterium]|nr:hypothetical protein [Clostridia bacterium]